MCIRDRDKIDNINLESVPEFPQSIEISSLVIKEFKPFPHTNQVLFFLTMRTPSLVKAFMVENISSYSRIPFALERP